MSPSDQIILKALSDAAEAGARCPTNKELSLLIGLPSASPARLILKRLELAGKITTSRWHGRRQFTICATGAVVYAGPPKGVGPGPEGKLVYRPAPALPPRVYRDPCPRCATRPDVGCVHGWTGEYFAQVAA
jgi:hypothetical protein